MSNSEMTSLIERLQKSNRRWKRLALSLLAPLGVGLLLLTTSVALLRARAELQARAALEQARQAEEQFRQEREQAKQRIKEAKGNVDAPQNKGQNP